MKISNFYFRGERNYLHGTTLFDYILNTFVLDKYIPRDIDFSFHKLTNKQSFIVHEEGILPHDKLVSQYKDNKTRIFIYEAEDSITDRFPYNEEGIKKECTLAGNKITIPGRIEGYSFIEKIIAAYKFLLTMLYESTYGKYVFARLVLSFIPEGEILIEQKRIISNKFFEGRIKQNGREIGTVFFAT